jgi:hypothetical protein
MKPQTLALAICVALVIGFAAGYDAKGKFVKADQFDAVASAQEQTRTNVQQSLEKSAAIEDRATASSTQVTAIRKTVAKRFEEQRAHAEDRAPQVAAPGDSESVSGPVCTWTLDVGTVGLLNAARTGANPSAASGSDAEGQASSGLGAEDLIDNDLQVVEQYRDLATRHDALVDFVQTILRK